MKIGKIDNFFIARHLEYLEDVIFVIHRHWICYIGNFLKWVAIGFAIPGFVIWLYPELYLYVMPVIIFAIYRIIHNFFDWYLDVIILTTFSIIHYEWNGFFHNEATRIEYGSIQSIGYVNTGVLSNTFNFGDVIISREAGDTIFQDTANPKRAEREIRNAMLQVLAPVQNVDPNALKSVLSEIVGEHMKEMGVKNKKGFRKSDE